MKRISGALLDVDGTLLDSNDAHTSAWVDALVEQGHRFGRDEIRKLVGMGADNLLPQLGLSAESGPGLVAKERQREILHERFIRNLRPFPGARELLLRMQSENIKRIVVTSSAKGDLAPLLRAATIEDLVNAATAGGGGTNTKPDPDLVHQGIELSGLGVEDLLMLGDSPYDVAAALQAGVGIVCLRCGGFSDAELRGAVAIYDGPADLLARFEGSPFMQ